MQRAKRAKSIESVWLLPSWVYIQYTDGLFELSFSRFFHSLSLTRGRPTRVLLPIPWSSPRPLQQRAEAAHVSVFTTGRCTWSSSLSMNCSR